MLQGCDVLHPLRRGDLLIFAGAAVVVVQPHQVGVDQPQLGQCVRHVLLIGQGNVQVVVHRSAVVIAAVGQLHVAAAHFPQVVLRGKRHGGDGNFALETELHKSGAFVLVCFRKGVFQRGAAIAHGIAAHLLGAVQVAQRHVVKGIEQAGI